MAENKFLFSAKTHTFVVVLAENKKIMSKIIGREEEIKILNRALASPRAELVAIYGRRRVGKTYLVQTIYDDKMLFRFTGENRTSSANQLKNFAAKIQEVFGRSTAVPIVTPKIGKKAFGCCEKY